MNLLIIILIFFYLAMAQRFFKIWFRFFQLDTTMSHEEQRLSWLVLLIGTILWPLIVPIAYLSVLEKQLIRKQEQLDKKEDKFYKDDTKGNGEIKAEWKPPSVPSLWVREQGVDANKATSK